tara:strand:- start:4 stop:558 length:555 start_codon:yes stop_codon:yes gene_type:complete
VAAVAADPLVLDVVVVQVVVEEETVETLVVPETLHQYHHLKVIMVDQHHLDLGAALLVEVVLEVLALLGLADLPVQRLLVLVVTVPHHQLMELQQPVQVAEVVVVKDKDLLAADLLDPVAVEEVLSTRVQMLELLLLELRILVVAVVVVLQQQHQELLAEVVGLVSSLLPIRHRSDNNNLTLCW